MLVDLGFAAGQGGGDDADIIWCVAYDAFQLKFAWLPQAREQNRVGPYAWWT